MSDCVEEEEFADYECLDQHDHTSCANGKQSDDVHRTDDIENYVAWSCQGFGFGKVEKTHPAGSWFSG